MHEHMEGVPAWLPQIEGAYWLMSCDERFSIATDNGLVVIGLKEEDHQAGAP